jgi:transcriptional regulator with XRE-family HTH domain
MTQAPIDATGGESKRRPRPSQSTADTGSATTSFASPDPDAQRRRDLALFLKTKRAALAPQSVGLQPGRRRRASGLLREEVAQRAGISPAWYTWMEQGREISPSTEVLEQLAEALLLTASERTHLLTLARPVPAARTTMSFSHEAPDVLVAWLRGLDQPAYALNGRWDVLAWNESACRLLGDFASVAPADRNILRMIFLWQHWRELFVEWQCVAASSVAQFRAETARHSGVPDLLEFTNTLARDSEEFARMWHAREVDMPQLKVKRMRHAELGLIELTYAPLRPRGVAADISVSVYGGQGYRKEENTLAKTQRARRRTKRF